MGCGAAQGLGEDGGYGYDFQEASDTGRTDEEHYGQQQFAEEEEEEARGEGNWGGFGQVAPHPHLRFAAAAAADSHPQPSQHPTH